MQNKTSIAYLERTPTSNHDLETQYMSFILVTLDSDVGAGIDSLVDAGTYSAIFAGI